ncbi:MAG: hypothetical protein JSV88_27575 [Candidatus Aminicenantes bacterium]|nr:MAG: hypothetical protein JSV88_27575 [Candidatus Aminicenantes bacterium]
MTSQRTIRKKEKGKKIKLIGDRDLKEVCKKIEKIRYDLTNCGKLLNDISQFPDFPGSSMIIVLKEVEYKYYPDQEALKRKVNKGGFLLFFEEVTDFFVKYFPESCSVLYRIELNRKEQIRGYIFLPNMVKKKEELEKCARQRQ